MTSGEKPRRTLLPLLLAIEDSPKPVVMAIHGQAFGGGLEVAMAGHYRVIAPSAQVGQPEVKLGIIPGAAGTQRLPRLAGVAKAVEMCAFGEPITAQEALSLGIVDRIIEGDLLTGAVAFAREIAANRAPKTRERNEKLRCRGFGHFCGGARDSAKDQTRPARSARRNRCRGSLHAAPVRGGLRAGSRSSSTSAFTRSNPKR